jgi:hypothetical protein
MSTLYPDAIDGYAQLPLVVDDVTDIDAVTVNRLRDAIVAIQQELGTTPSGSFDNVKDRIINISSLIDRISMSTEKVFYVDPINGDYQTIQAGIDAAYEEGISDGKVPFVIIQPGIYEEDVNFKPNVFVIGAIKGYNFLPVVLKNATNAGHTTENSFAIYYIKNISFVSQGTVSNLFTCDAGITAFDECLIQRTSGSTISFVNVINGSNFICYNTRFGSSATNAININSGSLNIINSEIRDSTNAINFLGSSNTERVFVDNTHVGCTSVIQSNDVKDIIFRHCRMEGEIDVHNLGGAYNDDMFIELVNCYYNGTINYNTTGITGTPYLKLEFVAGAWFTNITGPGAEILFNSNGAKSVGFDNGTYLNITQQGNVQDALDQIDSLFTDVFEATTYTITEYTTNTIGVNDDVCYVLSNPSVAGAVTVNLPSGNTHLKKVITIKDKKGDAFSNNITVNAFAGETIDGSSSLLISTNRASATLVFSGTEWSII